MTIVLVDGGEVEAGLGWSALTHSPGTAPSAPQTLAATNGAVDPTDIVVTWTEPTDKGGWSTIAGYEVELNTPGVETDFMPTMTASNAPAPYVVSASSQYSPAYAGWCAFDDIVNDANGWFTALTGQPWWLKIDLGIARRVTAFLWSPYRLDSYGFSNFPKDWQFQGSHDDVNWTTLVSANNYTLSANNTRVDVPNDTAYRYYRWVVTRTDDGGYCLIADIRLLESSESSQENQIGASSPVTFAAKPYGKTYDIRVRAQNRVGWGGWATLQYLHEDPIPALPTTNLFARWVAQDLALAEGATVASGAWLDRVSGLALSSTGSDSVYHASGGPGGKPYVSIPKAGKLYRTGMFTGWTKVDIWMVFQDPTNDSYYFLSVAPTGQYSPSATDSQYHGQGAQGASIYNGSMVNNLTQSIRSWIRARFFFSGTTSQVRLKDSMVNGGSNVTTHGDLSLGGHNSGSSEWNNLDLCEIVIYSGTGTTDPEGVMAHFKAKYGLT